MELSSETQTDRLEWSWFDLLVVTLVLCAGLGYHWHGRYWTVGLLGGGIQGDAQFWFNGALHISEGILTNYPGQGYRPGYFYLTGLMLPVFGSNFFVYHKFLVAVFLFSSIFLYASLRPMLGRWGAGCAIGLLVLNPFTAEWLATSTSDGTGLILSRVSRPYGGWH